MEIRRPRLLQAAAGVFKRLSRRADQHGRMKIWQPVSSPRAEHRGKAARIQAEKINAQHAFVAYIGPHVKLAEFCQERQSRRPPAAYPAHPEGHNGDPSTAIAQIQTQRLR